MDLTKITDVQELKALAYDQLAVRQNAERNLTAIETRLQQVAQEQAEAEKPKK